MNKVRVIGIYSTIFSPLFDIFLLGFFPSVCDIFFFSDNVSSAASTVADVVHGEKKMKTAVGHTIKEVDAAW